MLERNKQIQKLYKDGETMASIARTYNLTPERIGQIVYNLKPLTIKEEEDIRKRDGYDCQWKFTCKATNRKFLVIHFIDGDKTNKNGENLITLCVNCRDEHNRLAKESNTQDINSDK